MMYLIQLGQRRTRQKENRSYCEPVTFLLTADDLPLRWRRLLGAKTTFGTKFMLGELGFLFACVTK